MRHHLIQHLISKAMIQRPPHEVAHVEPCFLRGIVEKGDVLIGDNEIDSRHGSGSIARLGEPYTLRTIYSSPSVYVKREKENTSIAGGVFLLLGVPCKGH